MPNLANSDRIELIEEDRGSGYSVEVGFNNAPARQSLF
jgi:hypothetical protein